VPSLLAKLATIHAVLALVGILLCFRKPVETTALAGKEPESFLTDALKHRSFLIPFLNNSLTLGTGVMIGSM